MSLFQCKEWWSTRVSSNEEFDDRHLITANIDNNQKGEQQIIVGSFQGFLRIYSPQKGQYQVPHLLFEQNFNEPIIQIGVGKLCPTSDENALCILFFKKVMVLQFTASQLQLQCKQVYAHTLERNSYNMIIGKFGNQPRDYICIQSCDGLISVYEQDKQAYHAQLSKFLLPGPIAYNFATDSFAIFNSSYELESYKYLNIVANSMNQKKLVPDWSVNIGEQTVGIQSVERNVGIIDFVCLTEDALFIVSQSGQIRAQKKFEYPCANFKVLDIPEKHNILQTNKFGESLRVLTILISSFTNNLLLYEDFQLIWATKTENTAHALDVGTFSNQKGLIVTLNDEGWLQASYFGTSASLNVQLVSNSGKQLSYEQMDAQYHKLIEDIEKKEGQGKNKQKGKKEDTDNMNIHLQFLGTSKSTEYVENKEKYYQSKDGQIIVSRLRVSLTFNGQKAQNIQVFFNTPSNIEIDKNPFFLEELKGGGTPYSFEVKVYTLNNQTPYSSELVCQTSYHNLVPGKPANKDPRGSVAKIQIPAAQQCCFAPPIKSASCKITISTDKDLPNLNDMFDDICQVDCNGNIKECLTNPNAFTFMLANEIYCTILVSKNSGKYRIQSSKFEGIWFILNELYNKSNSHFKQQGQKLDFQFTDHVPLQDLFSAIDDHYNLRNDLRSVKERLEKKTIEFTTIQRRLLTRFKEKNPAPLNNLDLLLQKSYDDIIGIANKQENLQKRLNRSSQTLSVTVHLIHFLLKLRFNLSRDSYRLIQDIIPAKIINDEGDIGWEEITNANVIYLLKVTLKKEMKGSHISIEKIDDFAKFKKQMTFLFDKLSKGAF